VLGRVCIAGVDLHPTLFYLQPTSLDCVSFSFNLLNEYSSTEAAAIWMTMMMIDGDFTNIYLQSKIEIW
jgi:hypothetical protein